MRLNEETYSSVTKQRTEVVLEATAEAGEGEAAVWREYEFKCKPGAEILASLMVNIFTMALPGLVTRAPCTISPYHYRLDWLMWFAAFQNYQQVKYSNILSIRISYFM